MIENSVLVVAHPDDEVLWFSSIVSKVAKIVFVFIDFPPQSDISEGRRKSLAELPFDNIVSLEFCESASFGKGAWKWPGLTKYGIKLKCDRQTRKRYIQNYKKLIQRLGMEIQGYQNVITHSPWGEYGHEEHIQVYRAISALKAKMKYDIWFTNYISNKSVNVFSGNVEKLNGEIIPFKTDVRLGSEIKAIYQKNGCWTWYKDWKWFDEEYLIQDKTDGDVEGVKIKMNMIKVKYHAGKRPSV